MERRPFQVVLHLPGQHQACVFHWRIVKQPIQVCHREVLWDVAVGQPVFLIPNGHGRNVVLGREIEKML